MPTKSIVRTSMSYLTLYLKYTINNWLGKVKKVGGKLCGLFAFIGK